jgi:hypothetical protein
MRFEGKEQSLTREWFMKRRGKYVKKYLKEPPGWILGTIKRELNLFELCGNEMADDLHDQHNITLACIGDRTVESILLCVFGTHFILICYVSLLSQGMSYGLGVWQG